MFRKIFFHLAAIFTIAIFSSSCTIPIKAINTGPQNVASVPKEFDPMRDTLLVLAIPRLENVALIDIKSTIKLDEQMQKQYPYPYKIVSQRELDETPKKYGDTITYRFALVSERRLVKQKGFFQFDVEEGLAFVPGYKATYIDFAFLDRATKQMFTFSGMSTTMMKLAVKNLTTRIKNAVEQKVVDKSKSSSARNTNKSKGDKSFIKSNQNQYASFD